MNTTTGLNAASIAVGKLRAMFYLVPWFEMKENVDKGVVRDYGGEAVPAFIGLIILEFLVATLVCGLKIYHARDTYSSLLLGMTQQLVLVYQRGFVLALYMLVWNNFHLVDLTPCTWYEWVVALLAADMAYYWMHRHAHEYHLFWLGHSVHHSGEDYNLATALRQGITQPWFSWIWSMPIALIISPASFAVHRQLNTLYQFWIHTTLVGWLGPLEYILNTPSHHRMHHRPPGNRNYAGVLIIWDRVFGTFEVEDRQVDYYGLAKQVKAFDPLSLNTEHASRLLSNVNPNQKRDIWFYLKLMTKRRVKHKSVFSPLALFKPLPKGRASLWQVPKESKRVKYNGDDATERSLLYNVYLGLHTILTLALYVYSAQMIWNKEGSVLLEYFASALVLLHLVSVGKLSQSFEKGCPWQFAICVGLLVLASSVESAAFIPKELGDHAWTLAKVESAMWFTVYTAESVRGKWSKPSAQKKEA